MTAYDYIYIAAGVLTLLVSVLGILMVKFGGVKNKGILYGIVGSFLFFLVTTWAAFSLKCYNYVAPYALKSNNFEYEYGDEVSKDIKDYIHINDTSEYDDNVVEYSIEADGMRVGTYDCYIKWRKNIQNFTITVKDTVLPTILFNDSAIWVDYGEEIDLSKNVKGVTDAIDGYLEYTIAEGYNCEEPGQYSVSLEAKDSNGNISTKNFTVNVCNKPDKGEVFESKSSAYPKVYEDETGKITITKEWYKNAWCYVAHLEFSDYSRFGTACANGEYGSFETIYDASVRMGTIFHVNGCYSAPYLNYGVVRSGVVCNNKPCNVPGVYSRNTGKFTSPAGVGVSGASLSSLAESGRVTDTFCFGPAMLVGGSIKCGDSGGRAQRTFIGTNGKPGDLWVVVSDGRMIDGVSPGLTYKECAQFLKSKGCTFGVPLDGGGSSTMVFQGEVLNKATGRAVVDSVYFK